jgi:hypothetical protein
MAALREVIETRGVFCSLYSDRGSHFFLTPKAGEAVDKTRLTQVGRAMRELNVEMIAAYSPQARGRSERNFGTWQNRLPQELRLAGIGRMEEANQFLREHYIAEFNRMFAQPAREKGTAFRRCARQDLDQVFSIQTERTVAKDNTIAIRDRQWQLGANAVSADAGRLPGYHLRASGRHDCGALGTAYRRPVRRALRQQGKGRVSPLSRFPSGESRGGGFPPRREQAARQPKSLARRDAAGSPHKRAAAPL